MKNSANKIGVGFLLLGMLMIVGGITQFTLSINNENQLASVQSTGQEINAEIENPENAPDNQPVFIDIPAIAEDVLEETDKLKAEEE